MKSGRRGVLLEDDPGDRVQAVVPADESGVVLPGET
jgi:hypothetical protein